MTPDRWRDEEEGLPVMGIALILALLTLVVLGLVFWAGRATAQTPSPVAAPVGLEQAHRCDARHVLRCRAIIVHQARAVAWQKKAVRTARRDAAKVWHPDVLAAVELASRVSGVSFGRLWTISRCESTHDPRAKTGQYEGLFQLGARHRGMPDIAGLDPFDPYVNAMHAALYIARHGEGEWQCTSSGGLRW